MSEVKQAKQCGTPQLQLEQKERQIQQNKVRNPRKIILSELEKRRKQIASIQVQLNQDKKLSQSYTQSTSHAYQQYLATHPEQLANYEQKDYQFSDQEPIMNILRNNLESAWLFQEMIEWDCERIRIELQQINNLQLLLINESTSPEEKGQKL